MSLALIILLVGVAFALYCFVSANREEDEAARVVAQWEKLSTVEQYLESMAGKARGCRCSKCGSNSMRNRGLFSSTDARRQFNCNHCGMVLYRNTVR